MLNPLNDFNNDYFEPDELSKNLSEKYKPVLLSELEVEYDNIYNNLQTEKSFIVAGPKNCGKSTLIKLYLNKMNYDYVLIDDYTLTKESLLQTIKTLTKNILTIFNKKKSIILFDNFDYFPTKLKEYIITIKNTFILITKTYINIKLNYIYINSPTIEYLENLYSCIYFCENNESPDDIAKFKNYNEMFSILELNLSTNTFNVLTYDNNNYEYNDYLLKDNLTFNDKINIIDTFDDYATFQNSYINGINDIHNYQKASEYISVALLFTMTNYYPVLTFMGSGQYIEKKIKYISPKYKSKKKIDIWIPNNLKNNLKNNK